MFISATHGLLTSNILCTKYFMKTFLFPCICILFYYGAGYHGGNQARNSKLFFFLIFVIVRLFSGLEFITLNPKIHVCVGKSCLQTSGNLWTQVRFVFFFLFPPSFFPPPSLFFIKAVPLCGSTESWQQVCFLAKETEKKLFQKLQ